MWYSGEVELRKIKTWILDCRRVDFYELFQANMLDIMARNPEGEMWLGRMGILLMVY